MRAMATIPVLRIFDREKALEFYREYLGFVVDWEHRFEPALPVYMQVSRGELVIHLSEHHGDGTPGSVVYVRVQGIDALHRELSAKGYTRLRPGIEKTPWGSTCMELLDPFGNRLRLDEARDTGDVPCHERRDRLEGESAVRPLDPPDLAARCGEELRSQSPGAVRIARTVFRAMIEGLGVTVAAIAQRADFSESFVERTLRDCPTCETDATGAVVAFWGISRKPTSHKVIIEGTTLFAWCAWDALLLPALLDTDARIASTCPVTSMKVQLDFVGERLQDTEPPRAVMSLVEPSDGACRSEPFQSFCQHVHFLATPDAAREWLTTRDQRGNHLPLNQAWEFARRVVSLLPDDS